IHPRFAEHAHVRAPTPDDDHALGAQRLRWEGGQALMWRRIPRTARVLVARRDWRGLVALVDWTAPPMAPSVVAVGTLGLVAAGGSFAINAVVGTLSALITARLYGVKVIGEYALVTAPWLTLIQFSSVAEQVSLTKAVSVLPARHRMVAGLFLPILLFSAALTVVAGIPVMGLSAAALHGPIHQPKLVLPALAIVGG